MTINIVVPSLGESIIEATIAKWHRKVGEQINVDELLVELETDKITLEVSAPSTGKIKEIKNNEGDIVAISDIIGSMEEEVVTAQLFSENREAEAISYQVDRKSQKQIPTEKIFSPAADKIASENKIKQVVITSGKDGRVTKGDVLATIVAPQIRLDKKVQKQLGEERVKMTRLRKTIAKRLKDSQNTAAILSTFNEIDMSAVINYKKTYQDAFKEKHRVKFGFMAFFVRATVMALKEIPNVNAEIDGDYLVYKNYYNIGVAVGTEQGLVVPVVRNSDKLNHVGIEKEILILAKKARDGKLSMNDMQGGTFSITNGGMYGSLLSTPIINPPQSGILGMHNIVQRPMAINGEVVIRPMMYVVLSYDHRIVDGGEAVVFLRRIKELVEVPEKLFFDL